MKKASHFQVQPGWKLLVLDMGMNPDEVLRLAGLPGDLFVREGATVTPLQYFDLFRALEACAGGESLPLRLGRAISVESFHPAIFACLCSPDLNVALQRLARHKALVGPMTLTVAELGDATRVGIGCYGHTETIPRSLGLSELVFLTQLARIATRQTIVPTELTLPDPPLEPEPYTAFFGRPVRRGDAIRIAFAAADARRPFLTGNSALWDFFEPRLRELLSTLEAGASMRQRVHSVLLELLPAGQASIDAVAGRLALSRRSLQRHLGEESCSYQDILNQTRQDLATHYLRRSTISPGEIAYLLGFQDGNSFIRAFRNWTGTTPGEFRGRQRGTVCG